MLIKNTDATYCKIKDIKISGLEAYITVIVYSSKQQTTEDSLGRTSRVFTFYVKNKDTNELTRVSNNNYWVDRCNNYNNDSNNVDINLYKEIILTVDISNLNKSSMLNNRWVRDCTLLIKDQQNSSHETLWESEDLTLVSQEISLPIISKVAIQKTPTSELFITFKENFESQEDFNYTNSNLKTVVNIKSNYTNTLIESQEVSLVNSVAELTTLNVIDLPVTIEINILNNIDQILLQHKVFYNPTLTHRVFIKQNNTIKQINTCSINNKQVTTIKTN